MGKEKLTREIEGKRDVRIRFILGFFRNFYFFFRTYGFFRIIY